MLKFAMNTMLTYNTHSLLYFAEALSLFRFRELLKDMALCAPQTPQRSFILQFKYVLKAPSSLDNWST